MARRSLTMRQTIALRLRREGLGLRARWRRRELQAVVPPRDVAGVWLFATMRNECARLPEFIGHYRRLGVSQFLIVDNDSTDGMSEFLRRQKDVALWHTRGSYRASRYGMDWMGALLGRYGHDRWCLTVDADELLVYPDWETRPLPALCDWLDARNRRSFSTLLLDMYSGPDTINPGDPRTLAQAPWFDGGNYRSEPDRLFGHDWVQGGPRERAFFAQSPRKAPALNKIPLVRWQRGYAYVSSTHHLLPRGLNRRIETLPTGVLLHTKFLPGFAATARREAVRREHYDAGGEYRAYLSQAAGKDGLHHAGAIRFGGWRQLESLGLMSRGVWV